MEIADSELGRSDSASKENSEGSNELNLSRTTSWGVDSIVKSTALKESFPHKEVPWSERQVLDTGTG